MKTTLTGKGRIFIHPWRLYLIPSLLLLFGVAFQLSQPSVIEKLHPWTFDLFQQLLPSTDQAAVPIGHATFHRPDWANLAELFYLLVLGLGFILLIPRLGTSWCVLLGGTTIVGFFTLSWLAFSAWHILIDPLYPSVLSFFLFLVNVFVYNLSREAERKQVRGAFGGSLSREDIDRLAKNLDRVQLGGEMKEMTFLFADIRGFTTLAESFNAQELTYFLNRFLTPMTDLILKHHGTVDKYMGDCIMAFWNAPLDDPDHARNACRLTLEMSEYIPRWNYELQKQAKLEKRTPLPVRLGLGLNTGRCCVGKFGSEQRFDYSVIGDEVNVASRLQSQTKTYGVDIIIGQNTYEKAHDFAALELDLTRIKGKTKPVRIFGLLGGPDVNNDPEFQKLKTCHKAFLRAYRTQDWSSAQQRIEECMKLDSKLHRLALLYQLYRERIKEKIANPPGYEWDGVFVP